MSQLRNYYFRTGVGELVEQRPDPVEPPPPPPPPDGLRLYEVDPAFNPSTAYTTEQLNFRNALYRKLATTNGTTLRTRTHFNIRGSRLYPGKINLYNLRQPKDRYSVVRACMKLKPDPAWLGPIYIIVRDILDSMEYNWVKWPSDVPLPGASNDSFAGTGNGKTKADRLEAWGRPGGDENYKSPMWRNNPNGERPDKKKILYLNEVADKTSIVSYGTHLHSLDNFLGHPWFFWMCYILDVNRGLDPRYGEAADEGWDYLVNHWEPLLEDRTNRHGQYGFWQNQQSLHHNFGSHTNLYDCLVNWAQLRPETNYQPREMDVLALKYTFGCVVDSIYLYDVPATYGRVNGVDTIVANPGQYEVANYSHGNDAYARLVDRPNASPGPGDITYNTQYHSEVINMYLNDLTGDKGQKLTLRHYRAFANQGGMITQGRQTASTWAYKLGATISATAGDGGKRMAFNDAPQTLIDTKFGRNAPGYESGADYGKHQQFNVLGLTVWADPTPELFNMKQFWQRIRYQTKNTGVRYNVNAAATATGLTGNHVNRDDFSSCALFTSLMRPEVSLADLDLSWPGA